MKYRQLNTQLNVELYCINNIFQENLRKSQQGLTRKRNPHDQHEKTCKKESKQESAVSSKARIFFAAILEYS